MIITLVPSFAQRRADGHFVVLPYSIASEIGRFPSHPSLVRPTSCTQSTLSVLRWEPTTYMMLALFQLHYKTYAAW